MGEQYISIWELILLQLFLGSITYLIGSIVLFFVLRKALINRFRILILLLLQFFVSVVLSLAIYQFWTFDIDIMIGIILIPAFIAEIITISFFYFIRNWIARR